MLKPITLTVAVQDCCDNCKKDSYCDAGMLNVFKLGLSGGTASTYRANRRRVTQFTGCKHYEK